MCAGGAPEVKDCRLAWFCFNVCQIVLATFGFLYRNFLDHFPQLIHSI